MQRSKIRKLRRPEGQCYLVAGKVVFDEQEGILVHGRVWSASLQRMIDHAWIELPTGTLVEDDCDDQEILQEPAILDLTLKKKQRLMPKWLYFAIAKAEEVKRFTHEEMRAPLMRYQHWGPWVD